jgi:hypothetical protein
MTTTLKKLIGEAGAGFDQSHGSDRVYDVLAALVYTLNAFNESVSLEIGKMKTAIDALITSHNALLANYNAETSADHTTSTAESVATVSHSNVSWSVGVVKE